MANFHLPPVLAQHISPLLEKYGAEFRSNRRLQIGFTAVIFIFIINTALNWNDHLAVEAQKLQDLRSKLSSLRNEVRNEAAIRQRLIDAKKTKQQVNEKLWAVSSEPVGQARLKDWLMGLIVEIKAQNYKLTLANSKQLSAPNAAKKSDELREFRANVSFAFSPESLEDFLAEVESGEHFAALETLIINRKERRIEAMVRVLMRIGEPIFIDDASDQDAAEKPEISASGEAQDSLKTPATSTDIEAAASPQIPKQMPQKIPTNDKPASADKEG